MMQKSIIAAALLLGCLLPESFSQNKKKAGSVEFDSVGTYYKDRALVRHGGKYGFIDLKGRLVIPLEYEDASDFFGRVAGVKKEGKYGFIDRAGKEVAPFEFDNMWTWRKSGFKVMKDSLYGMVNKDLTAKTEVVFGQIKAFTDLGFGPFLVEKEKKWGVVDSMGQVVVPIRYDGLSSCFDGSVLMGLDGKFGFLDSVGNETVPLQYDKIWDWGKDLYTVRKDEKWGVIRFGGENVLPLEYDRVYACVQGYAILEQAEKFGIIDSLGQVVMLPRHDALRRQGGLFYYRSDGRYGLMTYDGRDLTPDKEVDVYRYENGLFEARKNRKYGVFDSLGRELLPIVYDELKVISPYVFYVKDGDKYGYLGSDGRELLPFTTHAIYDNRLWNNRILACKDDHYGWLDGKGKVAIPFEYDRGSTFSQGYARVSRNGKYGYIDTAGISVLPMLYDDLDSYKKNGVMSGRRMGKWEIIDSTLQVVGHYDNIESTKWGDGYRVCRDKRWGLMDGKGRMLTPIQYDAIGEFDSDSLAQASLNGKEGILRLDGKFALPLEFDQIRKEESKKIFVVKRFGKWGILDGNYREMTGIVYDTILYFERDFTRAERNGMAGVIDIRGREIVPCQYSNVRFADRNWLVATTKDGKYDLYWAGQLVSAGVYDGVNADFYGEWFQDEGSGDAAYSNPSDNYLCVATGGGWGVIDSTGRVVVPLGHDECSLMSNGLVYASKGYGSKGWIDVDGTVRIPLIYDEVDYLGTYYFDSDPDPEFVKVGTGSKYGLVDKNGKIIIPIEYDDLLYSGVPLVGVFKGNKTFGDGVWGFVDLQNKQVIPYEFSHIQEFAYLSLAPVQKGDLWGFINDKGKMVIEPQFTHCQREYMAEGWFVKKPGEELFGWSVMHDGKIIKLEQ